MLMIVMPAAYDGSKKVKIKMSDADDLSLNRLSKHLIFVCDIQLLCQCLHEFFSGYNLLANNDSIFLTL